jgi:hypothetical protein
MFMLYLLLLLELILGTALTRLHHISCLGYLSHVLHNKPSEGKKKHERKKTRS